MLIIKPSKHTKYFKDTQETVGGAPFPPGDSSAWPGLRPQHGWHYGKDWRHGTHLQLNLS